MKVADADEIFRADTVKMIKECNTPETLNIGMKVLLACTVIYSFY